VPDSSAAAATVATEAAQDKQSERLAAWRSTDGRTFESPAVAELYRQRAGRFCDIVQLKEPDRVPVMMMAAGFIARYGGITHGDMYYDAEKTAGATLKFIEDFRPDYMLMGGGAAGRAYDLIGYNTYKWPGGALPDDTPLQYVEGEYMPPEDYDALINNPEGYLLRTYYPRICTHLQGLKLIPNLFTAVELLGASFMMSGLAAPPLQEALSRIGQAIEQLGRDMSLAAQTSAEIVSRYGCPGVMGGMAKAPFDMVADTLRGTRAALMDLYRRPEKVLAAADALVPSSIQTAVGAGRPGAPPFVMMPLHKGADSFMSIKHFKTFYWPSFQRQLEGIIAAGMVPLPFVEGSFDEARLEHIAASGLPPGRTVWLFDRSDLRLVRKHFGGFACFGGNVPISLFSVGSPAEMEDHCKRLIDDVAPGGGFFLAPGAGVEDADPAVVRAFMASADGYGKH
jgi:uroporphyrinogen-III decarboxylase